MIGLIVTGHGKFASGLASALNLIAGPQKNFYAIDFEGDETPSELEVHLRQAFEELKECNGIIVYSDLPGGTPFKTSVMLSLEYPNTHVISGTNLPMLCEMALVRSFEDDVNVLAQKTIYTGQEQVVKYEMKHVSPTNNLKDGI